ncbi:proteoglycan 4-like isoform X3 [Mugil cephalus]|uniref:proteoglycan 4-like isoform X3 n=1 Tax=Mugil cephalus TaxID=48193 RepID=UPI001FB71E58|nr:proteoglycan 4-like isoform X3 [Mugil cephalus]
MYPPKQRRYLFEAVTEHTDKDYKVLHRHPAEMSLQVCHCCGWSKVTTHQGLRIHQGKNGCTPKGVRIAETQPQQCLWDYGGFPKIQTDLQVQISASIKTDTADYYSEMSLQVCHCGWKKMTTYHGLKTHQGMMGCTAKGMKKEQYVWKKDWEAQVDHNHLPAKKVATKRENFAETQRTVSIGILTATIKDEYESPSSQRATKSRSSHELQNFSTLPQINRPVRDHSTPAYPGNVVKPKERKRKNPTLSQNADRRSIDLYTELYAATTATIKEEPESPFALQQPSARTATKSKSGHQLQGFSALPQNVNRRSEDASWSIDSYTELYAAEEDTIKEEPESLFAPQEPPSRRTKKTKSVCQRQDFSNDAQVNRLVRAPPPNPPLFKVVRPKVKERKGTKMRSVARELPPTTFPVPVVQPKEKKRDYSQTLSENVQVPPINLQATTTTMEEPRSSFQTSWGSFLKGTGTDAGNQLQDLSSSEQVDRSVTENPKTPSPVQPKKESPLFSSTQERIKSELQQKFQMREEKMSEIRQVEAACKSVPDSTSTHTDSASSQNKDPSSLYEATQPDCSASTKVKELARMYSAVQETAVQPEETDTEKPKLSQSVPVSPVINSQTAATTMEEPRSPFTTPRRSQNDTNIHAEHQVQDLSEQMDSSVRENPKTPLSSVQPKKKESPLFKATREMTEEKMSESRPVETAPENMPVPPILNSQTTGHGDSSVRENPKTPLSSVQPKKKESPLFKATREMTEEKMSESRPVETAPENMPVPPILNSQTTGHGDSSVRENTKTPPPVQPKKKESPSFKATQETIQSKLQQEVQVAEERMSESRPVETACKSISDSATMNTRTDSAASQKEDRTSSAQPGFSTGMKVKELAQMFSTLQETAVQPEEKDREKANISQSVPVSPVIDSQTTATTTEEARSPFTTPRRCLHKDTNIHADHQLQVARSVRDNPKTPPPVQPKKMESPSFKATWERIQSELPQNIQMQEKKSSIIRAVEAVCESVPDSTSVTTQRDSAPSQKEDQTSLYEAAQPDFSNCMKVKELAQMFSAPTAGEAAVQPKDKDKEIRKLSQVKLLAQRFSANTVQETSAQPNEKAARPSKLSQKFPDSKIFARSVQDNPKTPPPVQPKKKDSPSFKATWERIQSELPQNIQMREKKSSIIRAVEAACEFPDSKIATINRNSEPTEVPLKDVPEPSSELSGFSTSVKVKDLARLFSAAARQEKSVQPMDKQREGQHPTQRKFLNQKQSAPVAQKTATCRPKEKDKENQKPSKWT